MTEGRNDENNWLVATMLPDGSLQVWDTDQAENVAHAKAEKLGRDRMGEQVFVYRRHATVVIEPVARWL